MSLYIYNWESSHDARYSEFPFSKEIGNKLLILLFILTGCSAAVLLWHLLYLKANRILQMLNTRLQGLVITHLNGCWPGSRASQSNEQTWKTVVCSKYMLTIDVPRALVRHFEWHHVVNWADSKSPTVNKNPCRTLLFCTQHCSAHVLAQLDGMAPAGTVMTNFVSRM